MSNGNMNPRSLTTIWPIPLTTTTVGILAVVAWLFMTSVVNAQSGSATSETEYKKHIDELREKLTEGDFHIRVESPFVVISDDSDEMLQRYCRSIRWAVDHLKNQYFEHDPDHIIDIWLFKNKQSYETNVEELFGEKPGTPFGYYSSHHRALVMNISTGGGTLVHEIVHPFIERNFVDCPSWFNEGLASLYEQSGEKDDNIVGYTNWRLRGLQRAIDAGTVPDFQTLCETTTREFYNEDSGTNYAQARYLCYYLQQTGKLNAFYHSFVKNAEEDSSGHQTLMTVLEQTDMAKFKTDWQEYVMKLKFE